MDIVKLIKMKCIENGVTPFQIEQELGYSNGYLLHQKFPMKNRARAEQLSERLNIPISQLLGYDPGGNPTEEQSTPKTTDFYVNIADSHGQDAADTVRMLLELNEVGQAELRGEIRQMLRMQKYNDMLS